MRIMTWNVNGIRSFKMPLKCLFDSFNCEIICIQETKVSREHLDEQSAIVEGYNSYFSFSKVKSGYSGVATFVKNECIPWLAEDGLSNIGKTETDDVLYVGCYGDLAGLNAEELTSIDNEGRCIMTEHEIMNAQGEIKRLVIINVYCPRAEMENEERLNFKLKFYKLLQTRAEEILRSGRSVIIVGDINTSHKAIDHCEPTEEKDFQSNPGRQWMNSFIFNHVQRGNEASEELPVKNGKNFVDILRVFHPSTPDLYTNWCTLTGARVTNYGTRLDYIFADKKLTITDKTFTDCHIRPDIMGSDHCPVVAELSCVILSAPKCPPICTKYIQKFTGTQLKLSNFFTSKHQGPLSNNSAQEDICDENQSLPESQTSASGTNQNSQKLLKKRSTSTLQEASSKRIKNDSNKITLYFSRFKTQGNSLANSNGKDDSLSMSQSSSGSFEATSSQETNSWNGLLTGSMEVVLCRGHKEQCLLRTVKKPGPNKGRQFWVCNRPEGHKSNTEAKCDYFEWVDKK